ncbi:hypothetical protein [Thioflexithrix psekupsensis]|uniref:hypothetical protein n=1 Tax=Thioflexithrix psekupsensis TaxID=1570016 RepID=UPI001C3DB9F1|nr:hypothetical protein [Thioflexithrix psekupsensis]
MNFIVGNKRNFFAIKRTKHRRRQKFIKSAGFANGENELNEGADNTRRACFGFCPQQGFLFRRYCIIFAYRDAKIDIANNFAAIVKPEIILSDFVFEFFFADVDVFHDIF